MKRVIYVANVAESDLADPSSNPHVLEVINLASELQSGMVTVSTQVVKAEGRIPGGCEKKVPKLLAWGKRCMVRESIAKSLHDPKKVYEFVCMLKKKFGIE